MAPSKKTSNKKSNQSVAADDVSEIDYQIQSLVRRRANLKGKLSRFSNYFNSVKNEEPNNATLLELELRLKEIESSLLSEFAEIQFDLEGLDPVKYNESELDSFETSYFSTISEIKQFLLSYTNFNVNQTQPQVQAVPVAGGGLLQSSATTRKPNAKLPVIELPKFSGQYERWLEFRDLYVSLVHKCAYLEPIEKFHYLRASLEGAAAQCIQSINFCAENYDIAWDILCQRFENKRLMVHNHIKALFNIYEVKPDSPSSFRNLVDLISKNIRSLENLGVDTKSWDPLIIYIVTSKLDVESIREWEQIDFEGDLPSLSELKEFLASRADFLDKIAMHKGDLPNTFFDPSSLDIPPGCQLADPKFYEPGQVDMLVGADTFWDLICNNRISLGSNKPVIQKSKLGWIISGPLGIPSNTNNYCHFSKTLDIQKQLEIFWEIEELPSKPILSHEELQAEDHFCSTYQRAPDGRFVVSIPLKQSPDHLGDSKTQAIKQFQSLERKLAKNPQLKDMYVHFMTEYQEMQHMSPFTPTDNQVTYFSPHHGVLREDSSTTKLRVVFNSSASSTSGLSYNSIQLVGPVVQEDLYSIILRFRQHQYVISADICKMYRQILVQEEYHPLQLILWRDNPSKDIQTFSLKTVTYGTASAPFLATRCLKQLALDHESLNPRASQVISRDFYVDDLLSGADSIDEAVQVCTDVSSILKSGCFELRKWKSNNKDILEKIKVAESNQDSYFFGSSEASKTLGMLWSCEEDKLLFRIKVVTTITKITKRVILSEISKIYDPLGLISPIIIRAKIMLQALWSLKLSWDDQVPSDLSQKWINFRSDLNDLNSLKISRSISCKEPRSVQLHGFSDASSRAYGACIYIRSVDPHGNVYVELLTSKTRVAPLKSVSIPRLELCATLLLSQVYDKVKSSLTLDFDKVFLWCDSTVALAWIRSSASNLQVFVGNRVAKIQTLTSSECWRYVPSEHNPADILSRGMLPKDLISSETWFHGPNWLKESSDKWPDDISAHKYLSLDELPEVRKSAQIFVQLNHNELFPFNKFSSFTRLIRVMAYCLRFLRLGKTVNCKSDRKHGPLTLPELHQAKDTLVRLSQQESFPEDFQSLTKTGAVTLKSRLLSLTPFLENNIIRVGGRLKHSSYSFNKKHPAVLCPKHHLTYLLFKHEHKVLLHGGPQLLLSHIRETFWPIAGKNLAKRIVRECVTCFRFNPKSCTPLMGNLPEPRVTPRSPFSDTGIDYAGPFQIKDRKGRGCKIQKCYLALFICLTTKAVHLEIVSELSTQAFLETFQRFISRRGRPLNVYTDNGSNFVGAHNQLRDLGKFLKTNANKLKVEYEQTFDIIWHFIAAYSPHHGGLWEAGVKSAKHHIKRVLANTLLTFESFYTVITQIEAILNSRPLTPLSSDPNDFNALTPAHLLIGRSLQTIPYPDFQKTPHNRLSHFEQLELLKQHFWSRWTKEYVGQLQQKVKWKVNQPNISLGTMVIVRDDNLPPFKWRLGRVVELHPGEDQVVRVVSIKTASGLIKRAVVKVCPLPLSDNPV